MILVIIKQAKTILGQIKNIAWNMWEKSFHVNTIQRYYFTMHNKNVASLSKPWLVAMKYPQQKRACGIL